MGMRILAALAVLVSAAVHLDLWPDVRDNHVIGPAFMLNAVGGVVIAVLLVCWKHWIPPLLAVGFGISTILAFTISATAGMYGVHEHWRGFSVWAALIAEVVAAVAGAIVLYRELGNRSEAAVPDRQPADSSVL